VPASHASPGKVMATHIGMERMSALASVPTKPADSLKDQNSSNRKVPMIFGPAFIAVHRSRKPATDDGAPRRGSRSHHGITAAVIQTGHSSRHVEAILTDEEQRQSKSICSPFLPVLSTRVVAPGTGASWPQKP